MRHEFLVVTVKEWLKLVHVYQSYRKNKSGSHLFWTTLYIYIKYCTIEIWITTKI